LDEAISAAPGRTLRFGIRRGIEAEERDVTPARWERRGPLNMKEIVGWIGVSPRFQLPEVGIIDLTSPAAQAGLRTFDYITSVNGTPVAHWSEFERAVARAVPRPCASPTYAERIRRCPSCSRDPGTGNRGDHSQPVSIPCAGGVYDNRHPGLGAVRLFGRARQPADRIGLRRGDQALELDGEPLLHWNLLRQRLRKNPNASSS